MRERKTSEAKGTRTSPPLMEEGRREWRFGTIRRIFARRQIAALWENGKMGRRGKGMVGERKTGLMGKRGRGRLGRKTGLITGPRVDPLRPRRGRGKRGRGAGHF